MLLTHNVIDPGYSGTLVAKVQANLKTPASPVRSYRGADAISLQNYVTYASGGNIFLTCFYVDNAYNPSISQI